VPLMQPNEGERRILVADDNAVNRKIVLAMLAKHQLRADVAENGQMALELMEQQDYHLVLMDCQMPVMNGYDATRAYRLLEAQRQAPATPIVALSADDSPEARRIGLNAGMDDFLSKPIDYHILTDLLTKWLAIGKQPDSGASQSPHKNAEIAYWDAAATLKLLEGDEELLLELIQLFLDNIPTMLSALHAAVLQQDPSAVAQHAHSIKSMVSSFFAESVSSLAYSLEKSARQGDSAQLPRLSMELAEAVAHLNEALRRKTQT